MDPRQNSLEYALQQQIRLDEERNELLRKQSTANAIGDKHDAETVAILNKLQLQSNQSLNITKEQRANEKTNSATLKTVKDNTSKTAEESKKNSNVFSKIWGGIKNIGSTISSIIVWPFKMLLNGISFIGEALWKGVKAVAGAIWKAVRFTASVVTLPLQLIWKGITAFGSAINVAWKAFKDVAKKAFNALITTVQVAFLPVYAAFKFTKWFLTETLPGKLLLLVILAKSFMAFMRTELAAQIGDWFGQKLGPVKDWIFNSISEALRDKDSTLGGILRGIVDAVNTTKRIYHHLTHPVDAIKSKILGDGNYIFSSDQDANLAAIQQGNGRFAFDTNGFKFDSFSKAVAKQGNSIIDKTGKVFSSEALLHSLAGESASTYFANVFKKIYKETGDEAFKYAFAKAGFDKLATGEHSDIAQNVLAEFAKTRNMQLADTRVVKTLQEKTVGDTDFTINTAPEITMRQDRNSAKVGVRIADQQTRLVDANKRAAEMQHADANKQLELLKTNGSASERTAEATEQLVQLLSQQQQMQMTPMAGGAFIPNMVGN